jgi:hypothetical protein
LSDFIACFSPSQNVALPNYLPYQATSLLFSGNSCFGMVHLIDHVRVCRRPFPVNTRFAHLCANAAYHLAWFVRPAEIIVGRLGSSVTTGTNNPQPTISAPHNISAVASKK